MKKVIVIVGPTGVGKTKMGVALAKKFNGEVISGDSMQIYKKMDIGTAKVTTDESKGIVHHLIDIKDPSESYSVKDFQDEVRKCIDDITSRDKLAIIVGGTGLYIKAALYDYEFSESEINHEFYQNKYKNYSNEELYQYLQSIDQASAQILHFNNRRRVLRAIEIYEATGVKKSETLEKQKHVSLYDTIFVGLTLPRDILYNRINKRVDDMIDTGLEKEAEDLYNQGYTKELQSMKAIGYKEWFDFFEGKQTKEMTIELIKKNSRNYAKKQYTWFNNQFAVKWIEVELSNFDKTINEVEENLII